MKLKKVLLEQIKTHLETKYGLDMFSKDIRLAFAIYYIKTAKLPLRIKTNGIMRGAYELFEETTELTTFTRNVYASIARINLEKENVAKLLFRIANEI